MFKSKYHLLSFRRCLNTRRKNLEFTFDFEQNNSFSFLDVKVTLGSKGFSSLVFYKATFSGVFMNFYSFIFESSKICLTFSLLFRCFSIYSDIHYFDLEVYQLCQIFKCNNYPVTLIDQCIKTFLHRIFVAKRTLITAPKKDLLIVFPFLGQFSLNLESRLHNCFNKTLHQCNNKVIFRSKNRLSNLFQFTKKHSQRTPFPTCLQIFV